MSAFVSPLPVAKRAAGVRVARVGQVKMRARFALKRQESDRLKVMNHDTISKLLMCKLRVLSPYKVSKLESQNIPSS